MTQIIDYYGARWKIEAGFKELKQEIGSQKSQCRNAHAVINHLQFCMMATTITWLYADHIKTDPERHSIFKRTIIRSFTMSPSSPSSPLFPLFHLFRVSPLDVFHGPGQLVFLAALAISTLTIVLVGNRLRDILHKIKINHETDFEANDGYKKTFAEWRVINYLIISQTFLIFLTLIRVFLSSFGIENIYYDRILIFLALAVLGFAWLGYFIWDTWKNRTKT